MVEKVFKELRNFNINIDMKLNYTKDISYIIHCHNILTLNMKKLCKFYNKDILDIDTFIFKQKIVEITVGENNIYNDGFDYSKIIWTMQVEKHVYF